MIKLVIDQGNTNTKIALFKKSKIIKKAILNNEADIVSWEKEAFSTIISLVEDQSSLLSFFKKKVLKLDHETKIPIINNYKTPKTLGTDRLAAVVGATKLFPNNNILVIDAGTCITFDLLKNNVYFGGSITSGINMRYNSLKNNTFNLPIVNEISKVELVGDSTNNSIKSGVLNGLLCEIDGMIADYKHKYSDLKVVITGGDCMFFDKGLKNSIFVDQDLVLKGLNEILDFNYETY
tara:strand:- start:373 stop:1080 length:708 start_codon:yes stop_codon:yes gene_type:complete